MGRAATVCTPADVFVWFPVAWCYTGSQLLLASCCMEQGGEVYGTFAFLQQFKLASLNATSYLKGQPLASYISSGIFEKERLESTWNIELAPNSAGKKKHAKIVFLQFVWNSTWTSQGETWALASRRAMFTDTPVSESSCTRSRSMFRTLWTSEANSPPQVQQASVERCAIKIRPRDRGQRWPAVSSAKKPFFQKMPHKTRLTGMDYTLTLQVQSLAHVYIYTHTHLRTWCCKFWVPVQIHDMKNKQSGITTFALVLPHICMRPAPTDCK